MPVKLIECPRDAMQGIQEFIPTQVKVAYLNTLLKVGFDTLDFGSFVSPKAIPQMQDTPQVVEQLDLDHTNTDLLAIIANTRGANDAASYEEITYLGYPFSISETFQSRNTNRTIEQAFEDVKKIQDIAANNGKELVVFISMGFGNPYGDPWDANIVKQWVERLYKLGIQYFSLSDTVGSANPDDINYLFSHLISAYPGVEFGAHFHSRPDAWQSKITAAYNSGCRRFDAAAQGYGGCPMAEDEVVGNIATENLIYYFDKKNEPLNLNMKQWSHGLEKAAEVFSYQ